MWRILTAKYDKDGAKWTPSLSYFLPAGLVLRTGLVTLCDNHTVPSSIKYQKCSYFQRILAEVFHLKSHSGIKMLLSYFVLRLLKLNMAQTACKAIHRRHTPNRFRRNKLNRFQVNWMWRTDRQTDKVILKGCYFILNKTIKTL